MDKQCMQTNPKCLIILAYHDRKQGWKGKEIKLLSIPQRAQLPLSMLELSQRRKPEAQSKWLSSSQKLSQSPSLLQRRSPLSKLGAVTQGDPDLMAWELHRRNQTSCLLLDVSGGMFVSDPLTPGFPHDKQGDADTIKGMVHLTLQVSGLGLNYSHPEYIIHWLKRDYSVVGVCVININISSKGTVGLHKVSLWQ